MSKYALRELLELLPYNLREEIDGYAMSIYRAGEEIFREAGYQYDEQILDKLVFFAGLKRIWSMVDTQYWIMDNSIMLIQKQGVHNIRIGGPSYGFNLDTYAEIRSLREEFKYILLKLGLNEILEANDIHDILEIVRGESSWM